MDVFSSVAKTQNHEQLEQKFAKAVVEKEEGNKFFKEGDSKKAAFHYHSALNYVNGLVSLSPEESKKVNEIKVSCNNNLAAVLIKDGKFERSVQCCNKVLEIEGNNVKALFRRGKAYLGKENLDKAEEDLKRALELDPTDKAIPKELSTLKTKSKKQEEKAKKFYSNMFQKISKEEESLYKDVTPKEANDITNQDSDIKMDESNEFKDQGNGDGDGDVGVDVDRDKEENKTDTEYMKDEQGQWVLKNKNTKQSSHSS